MEETRLHPLTVMHFCPSSSEWHFNFVDLMICATMAELAFRTCMPHRQCKVAGIRHDKVVFLGILHLAACMRNHSGIAINCIRLQASGCHKASMLCWSTAACIT